MSQIRAIDCPLELSSDEFFEVLESAKTPFMVCSRCNSALAADLAHFNSRYSISKDSLRWPESLSTVRAHDRLFSFVYLRLRRTI